MKVTVIYGTIVFNDCHEAIVSRVKSIDTIEADSAGLCEEIAEHNAGYFGGDYIIPELFSGTIRTQNSGA